MKKTTLIAVLGIPAAVALLVGIKGAQFSFLGQQAASFAPPPVKVTFTQAQPQTWENLLQTVGSLDAVEGVMVKAEQPGKIVNVAFQPGGHVNAGDLLVQQDTSLEQTSLRSAEAAAELADSNLQRARRMIKQNGVSISDLDSAEAQAKQAAAQVDNVKAQIAKKSIHAPFAGRLGVRQVSLGQDLRDGDPIVALQKLNPILVNFFVPQQQLPLLQPGLEVRVTLEDLNNLHMKGTITAINPQIDKATRNVQVQASVENADEQLLPGMFVSVAVVLPDPKPVLAVPATSILFAPYGDTVFVIEDRPQEKGGGKVVRQQIVKVGETRGDFVSIVSGLKPGESVVTTGAFKLFNGQAVEPDNSMAPPFELDPKLKDS